MNTACVGFVNLLLTGKAVSNTHNGMIIHWTVEMKLLVFNAVCTTDSAQTTGLSE